MEFRTVWPTDRPTGRSTSAVLVGIRKAMAVLQVSAYKTTRFNL